MSKESRKDRAFQKPQSLEDWKSLLEKAFPNHDFKWRRGSNYYLGLCPFHDDNSPSFSIAQIGNSYTYKCFACGVSGNCRKFLKALENGELGELGAAEKGGPKKEEGEKSGKERNTLLSVLSQLIELSHKEAQDLLLEVGQNLSLLEKNFVLLSSLFDAAADLREKGKVALALLYRKVKAYRSNLLCFDFMKDELGEPPNFFAFTKAILSYKVGVITPKVAEFLLASPIGQEEKDKLYNAYFKDKEGWVIFPFFDERGRVKGFKVRDISRSSRYSREYSLDKDGIAFFGGNLIPTYLEDKEDLTPFFVFEGETDALAFHIDSFLPALAVGGATKLKRLAWSKFPKFKPTVVVPDFDPMSLDDLGAGRRAVLELERERRRVYKETKEWKEFSVRTKPFPKGKDLCDALSESYGVKDFLNESLNERLEEAVNTFKAQHDEYVQRIFSQERKKYEQLSIKPLSVVLENFLKVSESLPVKAADVDEERLPCLLHIYPPNRVSLIAGQGGVGKTHFLTEELVRAIVLAYREGRPLKALYWTSEQTEGELLRIAERAFDKFSSITGEERKAVLENLYFLGRPPKEDEKAYYKGKLNQDFFSRLKRFFDAYDVIVLDPVLSFLGKEENDAEIIRSFMEGLNLILLYFQKLGKPKYLLLVSHTNKKMGEEFNLFVEDYVVHDHDPVRLERPRIRIENESKIGALVRLIRGSSAYIDASKLVMLITYSYEQEGKKRRKVHRLAVVVKSNLPACAITGYGEILTDFSRYNEEEKNAKEAAETKKAEKAQEDDDWPIEGAEKFQEEPKRVNEKEEKVKKVKFEERENGKDNSIVGEVGKDDEDYEDAEFDFFEDAEQTIEGIDIEGFTDGGDSNGNPDGGG